MSQDAKSQIARKPVNGPKAGPNVEPIGKTSHALVGDRMLEYFTPLIDTDGSRYVASSWGAEQSDGTWMGWLEFRLLGKSRPVLKTERETTQPSREALWYWATGLEPIYFEGAFARARKVDREDAASD